MPSTAELRDLWETELAAQCEGEEPEEQFEIARLAWRMGREPIPVVETDPERTWIWSDLHLGDEGCRVAWQRPFRDVRTMNRELLAAWRRRVRPGDTVICLGDVAHPDYWRERRNVLDVLECPGERILVLGNHDVRHEAELAGAGFSRRHVAALTDTSPRLALAHIPLRRPPITAWNVHGHTHGESQPGRRTNVSVEVTGYVPRKLADVLGDVQEELRHGGRS